MKILKIRENKDGSATMDYEITQAEKKLLKKAFGIKRLTIKKMNKCVYDILIKSINREAKKLGVV